MARGQRPRVIVGARINNSQLIITGNNCNDNHIDKRTCACRRSFYSLQLAGMCQAIRCSY